jgi:hypothetical protein
MVHTILLIHNHIIFKKLLDNQVRSLDLSIRLWRTYKFLVRPKMGLSY